MVIFTLLSALVVIAFFIAMCHNSSEAQTKGENNTNKIDNKTLFDPTLLYPDEPCRPTLTRPNALSNPIPKHPTIKYEVDLSGKKNITDEKLMCLFIDQIGIEEIERLKNKNVDTVFIIRGTRSTIRQIHHIKYKEPYTVLEIRVKYNDLMSAYTSKENHQRERNKLTSKLRLEVKRRDNYTCRYCGKEMFDGVGLQIDHIIPIAKGGKTELDNLQVLCSVCNRKKSDKITPTCDFVR